MDQKTTAGKPTDAIIAFEQALEQLVLESYTKGVPVERTWTFTNPVTDAPNWTVTIEKTYSEESAAYEPTLLEE